MVSSRKFLRRRVLITWGVLVIGFTLSSDLSDALRCASGCLPEPTVDILSIAIHVVEHPSEGILTAHLRPFVPAISNEKPLALR